MSISDARFTRRQALALGSSALLAACGKKGPEGGPERRTRSSSASPRTGKPNIIVYLSDTLRADHLGYYGFAKPATPFLDEFCKESTVFERCYAHASWTKPSFASIYTGLMPIEHRAVAIRASSEFMKLGIEFTTMAMELRAAGYCTGLFTANMMAGADFGLAEGYDTYRLVEREGEEKQMDRVLSWLEEDAPQPFFLFVHALDPHSPYTPSNDEFEAVNGVTRAKMRDSLSRRDKDLLGRITVTTLATLGKELSEDGVRYLRSLYAAEIHGIDAQFGRLVNHLRETGQLDNTIIAFTSDHGESLKEHGNFGHGHFLYNEELHVPLVIRHPGSQGGSRVPWTVGHCDMHATLLGFAGIGPSEGVEGAALMDEHGGVSVDADLAVSSYFSYLSYHWYLKTLGLEKPPSLRDWTCATELGKQPKLEDWACAMIRGRHKVIAPRHEGEVSVYDLLDDPGELSPVPQSEWKPETASFVDEFRAAAAERYQRSMARGFKEGGTMKLDERQQEELRALGYIG